MKTALTRWEVWRAGALWADLTMRNGRQHNALNGDRCRGAGLGQGVSKDVICAALASFKSGEAKNGLEVAPRKIGGIAVIEDLPSSHGPFAKNAQGAAGRLSAIASVACWSRAPTRCAAKCSKRILSRAAPG